MHVRFKGKVIASEREISRSAGNWTPHGWNSVTYRIATNPGEPLKPLHEIASGGEMSRVMLALKVSVEEGAPRPKRNPQPPHPGLR